MERKATMFDSSHVPTEVSDDFGSFRKEVLKDALDRSLAEVEARYLEALMTRFGGNVSQAARASGIHRSQLQKMLARHRRKS
jgi:DNA-binding protein Fis